MQIFNFSHLHSNAFLLLAIIDDGQAILISISIYYPKKEKFNSLCGSCSIHFLMREEVLQFKTSSALSKQLKRSTPVYYQGYIRKIARESQANYSRRDPAILIQINLC